MTESGAALDMDRLPWLTDDRPAKPRSNWSPVLLWAALATLLVAGAAFWLGRTSVPADEPEPRVRDPRSSETVALPPVQQPAAPSVEPEPMREVAPVAPPPQVTIREVAPPRPVSTKLRTVASAESPGEAEAEASEASEAEQDQQQAAPAPKVEAPRKLEYWPASESAGASGRVVRIGTFGNRLQAKRAWWRIVKVYPGMKRMNATVVGAPSLRNGRTYYRLQFGTTSQAHSEILCQRMRIVGQSCVVVGVGQGG